MLKLLITTRLRYYRNYIRYHFDRPTRIRIFFIIIILALLMGRSPADMGYSLAFLTDQDFPGLRATFFARLLPVFYLAAEVMTLITLRAGGEWQILGLLPIGMRSVANYQLVRQLVKTIFFLFLAVILFTFGPGSPVLRPVRALAALGIMITLQLLAFCQAYTLRYRHPFWKRIVRWLLPETLILTLLVIACDWLRTVFIDTINLWLFGLLLCWGISVILVRVIGRQFQPTRLLPLASSPGKVTFRLPALYHLITMKGMIRAFISRDLIFMWRRKRSFYFYLIIDFGLMLIVSLVQASFNSAVIALLFVEFIFCFVLINKLLSLFEQDLETAGLIRSAGIDTGKFWLARWIFATGHLALPVIPAILMVPYKFGFDSAFFLFTIVSLFVIPMVFATIFCSAGFGLFPHLNFSTYMLNLSLAFIILLWFFMPFGSILILGLWIVWIPKSLRHFQRMEIV